MNPANILITVSLSCPIHGDKNIPYIQIGLRNPERTYFYCALCVTPSRLYLALTAAGIAPVNVDASEFPQDWPCDVTTGTG